MDLDQDEALATFSREAMACGSHRKMKADEVLALIRSTRQELDPGSLQVLQSLYSGWLESELSEGLDGIQRANVYADFRTVEGLLTAIIYLMDESSFSSSPPKKEKTKS
jgi:hypothetical protein